MSRETREYAAPKSTELERDLETAVRDRSVSFDEERGADVVDADLVREMTAVTSVAIPGGQQPADLAAAEAPAATAPPLPGPEREYWEDRARRLQQELEAASSNRRAALLLHELGRIYEAHLRRVESALTCYRESHARYPGLLVNARALGRLLDRAGDTQGRLAALDSELVAATTAERAALLVERAEVHRSAGDQRAARDDLLRALELDPADPVALEELAELSRAEGNAAELEQLLRKRLRTVEDPAVRSALLTEVARLRETALGDLTEAATLYRTALNAMPDNAQAMRALLGTARRMGDYPAVAKLCEQLAAVDSDARAEYLWEAARVYANRLRNADLALGALKRASEELADPALLSELAALCEREKRWEDLAPVLERLRELTADPGEAAALGFQLALVQLQRLQQPEQAIATLRAAVEAAPEHLPARRLLGRLYSRHDRHEEVIKLLEQQRDLFVDHSCRAVALYRIGDLLERRLEDLPRAAEAYEQSAQLLTGYRPAVQGLGRVYSALGRFEELIAIYEREVADSPDRGEKALLLARVAEAWEQRLGDAGAAVSAYERLLALEPANAFALRALRRIHTVGGRWSELIGVLRAEADQVDDRFQRVALLTEIAEVREQQLDEPEAALETYLEVLDHAPDHQPALIAAGRLLKRAGDHQRLVELHRRELDACDDPAHRGWLLLKIARLLGEELGQDEEAVAALEEASHLDPAPRAATDQLIWIHRRRGDHSKLFELLIKQPLPESPEARSLHHRQIAEVLQHSQRPALAVEHLRRALAASDDDASVQLLGRLYVAIDDRQSLIKLHKLAIARTTDPHAQQAARHRLARLYATADLDLERAVETLERLLERAPRDRVILRQLESLLLRLGRWDEAVAVLELARETSEDEDYRRACAMMVAGLREDRQDDLTGAAQSAVDVLAREPTNAEALATLERYYRAAGNAEALGQVHSRQVRSAQTVAEQSVTLSAIAAIHAQQDDLQQAAEIFRLAAERMPGGYLPAILGWQRAATQLEQWAEVAEALEQEAAATLGPERQAYCLFRAATTWTDELDDAPRAIAAYRRVLEIQPAHQDATAALSALYSARQEHEQLVELLLHAAGQETTRPTARRDLLARAAGIQHGRLKDLQGARRSIDAALEVDPSHQPLLTTLAELCRLDQDYRALAQVNQRLVRLTEDPVLLKALHFELGMLWEEKLDDVERAIREYRRVLELDGSDLGALTRLGELLFARCDWLPAAQVTEVLIARDHDRGRVREYHLRLAQIYAKGFSDLPGAIEACRRALALDPGDLRATERMAKLLAELGDLRALHAHLESTLTVHRARLDQNPFRVPSYHALLRVFARQRAPDRSYVVCGLLSALGGAGKKERAFFAERRDRVALAPRRALTEDEVERLLVHPEERGPLRRLLVGAEPALRKLLPAAVRSVGRPIKVTNRSAPELAPLLRDINRAIGGGSYTAYLVEAAQRELWVEDTSTPSVFVAESLHQRIEQPETRFRLARALAHLRLRHALPGRLGAEGLEEAVAALLTLLCSTYSPTLPADQLEPLRQRLDRALPRRSRAALESPSIMLVDRELAPDRWLAAMVQSEDRIGLAVCGDVAAAIHTVLREESGRAAARLRDITKIAEVAKPRLRQLLSFAVSDEYLTLRERIGLAIS